ncbi:MAG: hypothetical protein HKN22_07590 [Bacteroidia bacterium]|nr:hypothetical protein [Bacteroidia bacterium]
MTFCIIFSLFFAFSVGLSTSNFGSLVRYKIPLLPFFVAALFITAEMHRQYKRVAVTKSMEFKTKPVVAA